MVVGFREDIGARRDKMHGDVECRARSRPVLEPDDGLVDLQPGLQRKDVLLDEGVHRIGGTDVSVLHG